MPLIAALVLLLAQERPTAQGEVVGVEGRALKIQIKRDGGKIDEQTFKVPEDAAITVDGEKAKLADLKPGRMVRIYARGDAIQRIDAPRKREESSKLPDLKAPEGPKPPAPAKPAEPKPPEPPEVKPAEKTKTPEVKAPEKPLDPARDKPVEKPKAPEGPKPPEPPKAPVVKPVEAPKPVEKPKAVEPPKPPPPPPPPPEPPKPFPVDESIVPKSEKYPDLGGRVLSVFEDGPLLLVTIRQNNEEIPFYLPKDATVAYVGLEKPDQKPRVGYLAYAWLKPGSKDTAGVVRFGRPK